MLGEVRLGLTARERVPSSGNLGLQQPLPTNPRPVMTHYIVVTEVVEKATTHTNLASSETTLLNSHIRLQCSLLSDVLETRPTCRAHVALANERIWPVIPHVHANVASTLAKRTSAKMCLTKNVAGQRSTRPQVSTPMHGRHSAQHQHRSLLRTRENGDLLQAMTLHIPRPHHHCN